MAQEASGEVTLIVIIAVPVYYTEAPAHLENGQYRQDRGHFQAYSLGSCLQMGLFVSSRTLG